MPERPLPDVPPEKYRTFQALPVFNERWEELGLTERDLLHLMGELMADPAAGTPVPGGGGLRKARFAPPSWATGKSGGCRVYYAHFPGYGVVVLAIVFAKSEGEDIGVAHRKLLAAAVGRVEAALQAERRRRRKKT
jgi:hypothetical protein